MNILVTGGAGFIGSNVVDALGGTKARKELGFTPQFSLEEGLEKTIKWYEENNNL